MNGALWSFFFWKIIIPFCVRPDFSFRLRASCGWHSSFAWRVAHTACACVRSCSLWSTRTRSSRSAPHSGTPWLWRCSKSTSLSYSDLSLHLAYLNFNLFIFFLNFLSPEHLKNLFFLFSLKHLHIFDLTTFSLLRTLISRINFKLDFQDFEILIFIVKCKLKWLKSKRKPKNLNDNEKILLTFLIKLKIDQTKNKKKTRNYKLYYE